MIRFALIPEFNGYYSSFLGLFLIICFSLLSIKIDATQDESLDRYFRGGIPHIVYRPIPSSTGVINDPVISLDGIWRINPEPPEDFEKQTSEVNGWKDFIVPGQWLQQGFDIPKEKTIGISKTFIVPQEWEGNNLILRFDAIHAGTHYYLNGNYIGYSENLFTPVEWDITQYARFGNSNTLVLSMKVETPSERESFSSLYAMHNLGGIDRSVHLFVVPAVHISSLHYETKFDEKYKDAELITDIVINNTTAEVASDLRLELRLFDSKGQDIKDIIKSVPLETLKTGENKISFQMPVKEPTKWNAEKPYLYELEVRLIKGEKEIEVVKQNIGFRTIEIKNKQLYINGKLVKILGTGLHQVNPLSGRADTAKYAAEDVRLMKEANLNYTRTCHYPYPKEFLDECDRQGLYVESEAPFCWSPGNNDLTLKKYFLLATAAMVEYHRNHPSIIIWSLENETPVGACIQETLKYVRKTNPTRLITDQERAGDCEVSGWHYGPFPCDIHPEVRDIKRPTLYGEYMPVMSDHFPQQYELNPGLDTTWSDGQNSNDSYVSQLHHSPHIIGGAMWGLIDDEFVFADRTYKGYGRWGLIDAWRRKKSNWWDCKLMHSPAWIPIREIEWNVNQKYITIPVENRYSFTNLNELKCSWELNEDRGVCELDVPPRTEGKIVVPLPKNAKHGDMIVFRFEKADGYLVSVHGVRLIEPSKQYFTFNGTKKIKKHTINMDGDFSEWNDIPELTVGNFAEKAADAKEGNDIEKVWMTADDENLYFCIKCANPIKKKSDWYPTFIVIDIDNNPKTGYPSKPLGIDYLIQPFGETRQDIMIHRRRAEGNNSGWSLWHDAVIVDKAYIVGSGDNNNCVEMRIPWRDIGISDSEKANFRFRIEDGSVGLYPESGDWVPDLETQKDIQYPNAGKPEWNDDGKIISITTNQFVLKIDKSTGKLIRDESIAKSPLVELPSPFFVRSEPLNMKGPHKPEGIPYAEYPDLLTRKIESLKVEENDTSVSIVYNETYKDFAGRCILLIDKNANILISFDYEYTGTPFTAGETGIRMLIDENCREMRWRRNAEWDVYPEDHIDRAVGVAVAQRPGSKGEIEYPPFLSKPAWSWALDENEFGTRDFRSTKHHIYNAELLSSDGSGVSIISDGKTTDVRANLFPEGVELHILNGFKPARPLNGGFHLWHFRNIATGYKLSGQFLIKIIKTGEK